jgi:release factor glutamine methyltransferase
MADFHPLRSLHSAQHTDAADAEWDKYNQQAAALAASQPRAPLPSLEHLTFRDFDQVYEPSDDTYLLLDAIQYELQQINDSKVIDSKYIHDSSRSSDEAQTSAVDSATVVCLEIGCGTGVPSVFFRTQWMIQNDMLSQIPLCSIVTDINPKALTVTRQTFQQAATLPNVADSPELAHRMANVRTVQCDLASALLPELEHAVHFILFNPPYVPTPDDEVYHEKTSADDDHADNVIQAAWAGGVHGRRVMDRAVEQMARLLQRPNGMALLVTVDENRPAELARSWHELGLQMRPLFRRQAKNEFLTIQKITWMDDP